MRALRRRFESEGDEELGNKYKLEFKRLRSIHKKKIIEAKKNSFKKYINEVTTSNVFATAYKIIRDKIRMSIIENIKQNEGSFTNDYYESKREILRYHFPYEDGMNYDFQNSIKNDYMRGKLVAKKWK